MATDKLKYPVYLILVLASPVISQISVADVPTDADIQELERQIQEQEMEVRKRTEE